MGRFASTVEFYSRFREPYPPQFFKTAAERLALRGNEALLDIGCGPGLLTLGFAPYVGRGIGLDPETAMIAAARAAAAEADVALRFIHGTIEQFSTEEVFDVVTIGRALHWLGRDVALPVLERIVSDSGRILICRASSVEGPEAPWLKPYNDVRHSWTTAGEGHHHRTFETAWFEGSRFGEFETVSVSESHEVTVADLVGRALSKSNTSPEKLGKERGVFEAELTAVLEPFARQGVLQEHIVARATIFARQLPHN